MKELNPDAYALKIIELLKDEAKVRHMRVNCLNKRLRFHPTDCANRIIKEMKAVMNSS